jgi:raffinose/stachyose/melibiose transport system permease protein
MAQNTQQKQQVAPAQRVEGRSVTGKFFSVDGIMNVGGYVILILYSMLALYPIIVVISNSFKNRRGIFREPYALPGPTTIEVFENTLMMPAVFDGYETVLLRTSFLQYYWNSFIITILVLVLVLFFGAMAAFALSEYRFRGNGLLGLYFALGIMIPIRLGTVSIIRIMDTIGLQGTIWSLVILYTAWGIPITVFILTEFIRDIPRDLKDAARVDGASEYRIFFQVVVPIVRPALATVAVFHMIPVWNDLWWPLVLANSEKTRTIMLGVSEFVGQFRTDYGALLAALTVAMVPILIMYAIFSRQLIRGISAGAVKS